MRSAEPTEVPPYFCTINAIFRAFCLNKPKGGIITAFYGLDKIFALILLLFFSFLCKPLNIFPFHRL